MTVQPQTQTTYLWKDDQNGTTVATPSQTIPAGWIHLIVETAQAQHVFDLSPANAQPFITALQAVLAAQQVA